jgi:hypothetical protein
MFKRMVLFGSEGDLLSNIRLEKMRYEELQVLKLFKTFSSDSINEHVWAGYLLYLGVG